MEENYLLSVTGKQYANGESDKVSLKTPASYVMKNGSRYITYKEYDVHNPERHYRTTIKVSPDNIVTVMKGGTETHNLVLEKGVRHKCEYITGFGSIFLNVYTEKADISLDDNGGSLKVRYSIDINSELASTNELIIDIEEDKKCQQQPKQ